MSKLYEKGGKLKRLPSNKSFHHCSQWTHNDWSNCRWHLPTLSTLKRFHFCCCCEHTTSKEKFWQFPLEGRNKITDFTQQHRVQCPDFFFNPLFFSLFYPPPHVVARGRTSFHFSVAIVQMAERIKCAHSDSIYGGWIWKAYSVRDEEKGFIYLFLFPPKYAWCVYLDDGIPVPHVPSETKWKQTSLLHFIRFFLDILTRCWLVKYI